jgi:uncharacterized membrane protein YphA (DoxX/SURF4 family)
MAQSTTLPPNWSRPQLVAFRFFFVYFVLYVAPFPLDQIPFLNSILTSIWESYFTIVNNIVRHLEGIAVVPLVKPGGSGDTTYNYIQLYVLTIVSLVATLVWTILNRKSHDHQKLHSGLTVLLRYYLAVKMMYYGLAKIFGTQFPFPSLERLGLSYGESSPMGLLWTFMGYSHAYNVFAGLAECLGGALLFFRRTRLLGALVVVAVMTNVVMLNMTYDVPVKLFSMHLLCMSLFIVAADFRRLVDLFLLNRPTDAQPILPIYKSKKGQRIYLIGKGLIILYFIVPVLLAQINVGETIRESRRNKSLTGEYEVKTFVLNGDTIPAGTNKIQRWRKFSVHAKSIEIQNMDRASISWHLHSNVPYGRVSMISPDLSTHGDFQFVSDSTTLTFNGLLHRDTLSIISIRTSAPTPPLLVDRGFHWVNEYPYNR